jgi:RNA polymerase subunit RPABC4/transcription elongation factor Spt4
MGDIIQTITDTIGEILDNPILQLGLQAFAFYMVILWLAAAYWAFRDIQLRTENPLGPYLVASLVILFTPVFFPLAVMVYRVIRPQEKIGEVYERNLAEEALLAEVESVRACPTCSRRVDDEWIICPTCRTRLNRVCPNCNRLVGLDWTLCAWCGRDFDRRDLTPTVRPVPALGEAREPAAKPQLRPGTSAEPAPQASSMARPTPVAHATEAAAAAPASQASRSTTRPQAVPRSQATPAARSRTAATDPQPEP